MIVRTALMGSVCLFFAAWIPFIFVVLEWHGGAIGDFVQVTFGSWENLMFGMFGTSMILFFLGTFVFPSIYERKFKRKGTESIGEIVELKDSGSRINERPVLEIKASIKEKNGLEKIKVGMKTPEMTEMHLYQVGASIRVMHIDGQEDMKVLGLVRE